MTDIKSTSGYKVFLSYFSLSTSQQRITTWLILTLVIFVIPFRWLENLSLYKLIGWDWAPSIGLTRAYWLLLHGKIEEAWSMNSLIFAVLAIGLPLLAADAYRLVKRAA